MSTITLPVTTDDVPTRRDVLAQLDDNTDRLCALLVDMDKPGADLDAIETRVEIVLAEHRVLVATLTALKGQK